MKAAIAKQDLNALNLGIELLKQDVAALPENSIVVREKWREIKSVQMPGVIDAFSPATREVLRHEIAPWMQWRNLQRREAAYQFDLLVSRLSSALIKQSAELQDLKAELLDQVSRLPINLAQVKEKAAAIEKVKKPAFWSSSTVKNLDDVRLELRVIMHLRTKPVYPEHQSQQADRRRAGHGGAHGQSSARASDGENEGHVRGGPPAGRQAIVRRKSYQTAGGS